ncbi:hypothetical protein Calab_1518 [Caldithrix abyssi DSM 13497]|uniref:Portal protein n=1 Tax=Caldithrix abyssi DSM 13497 TaxID=880073 RepID=H1XTE7_CALAY|nr:DUF935 family protein [Caldithrix abyssi]APF16981.1 Protein of unknown function (DUF935) [Caldithrix abyssi DSM 13497]APF20330.1 Protein of unknown function (DUF935) [Caldithrix abyssi DSM 13497]EHO40380.1 hypothetical protein Calab_0741 [Caldithrix abyssi DSM 13497]EHO41138.1 hypothetical protein Calab_1518 [Caldithrix abyssi DSM 13497]
MNLNKRVYPTLQEFFKYAQMADIKDPEARNIVPLMKILKRAFLANPRILGHYITRTTALASFDWQIVADDMNAAAEAQRRVVKAIDYIVNNHAKTAFYGRNVYKLKIDAQGNEQNISIIEELDQQTYDLEFERLLLIDESGRIIDEINLNENQNYLVDIMPFYVYRGGILRTLMPLEIIRYDIILENANYLRKLKGILQIINKGASTEEQTQAEIAAQKAIQHNYVVTSDFVEFKLNQIAQQAGTNFKDFIDLLNRDIAIAILGQANTPDLPSGSGSRAALQIQKMISADIMYTDMIRVEKLINRLLLLDYKLNFNPNATEAPYKFQFIEAQEQDIEKNAAALETLSRFLPIKKQEAYAMVGLTPPEPDDELL